MADLSRRRFLSASAASAALPFVRGLDFAWQPPAAHPPLRPLVTFDEPGFPLVDAGPLRAVAGARPVSTAADLAAALEPDAILVWRHGSTFPAEAWPAIARFLEDGGGLLYASGEPFTRPVTGAAGSRRIEPRTVSYLQALRLNQSYRLDAAGARVRPAAGWNVPERVLPADAWISALEPRLSDTRDFPQESGTPGARDALVRPLAYAYGSGQLPFAAAAYAIDRLRGPYAGGRWVFWLCSAPPQDDEWTRLVEEAARRPVDLRADPAFGCFHDAEQPSILVRVHRPRGTGSLTAACTISCDGPGRSRSSQTFELAAGEHGTTRVPLSGAFAPGFYRVTLDAGPFGRTVTGFWMFDAALFASGDALTFDDYTMRRNGRPEPIVGTTTMSATVHRDFLFEPNAAVWDDTFAELASLHVNAIRTGLWSGWRKITIDANVVDEGVLRALEAFYLTARSHGLPVIFNTFAFVPEDFGGADPYFDPRSIEGQRAFLSAVARRMAPAREFIWDLINEPSFASPRNLWSLRPSRSPFERRAFLGWLKARYQPAEDADPATWQEVVRRRWRLRADQPVDLPADEDFADSGVLGARRPYRTVDYALFAQDAFERWIGDMRSAIRDGGSAGPVTVGQDEAGLGTSPAPLFHHRAVDFTSMHTWWNNDALLWDGVLSKASGTPLLVSETGIMQRQLLSGEAVRSPREFADLLSRKIGYAFASGAFGVVQWCYETNPFMDSDNEVAIGLKRVDGSVKPEHGVLAEAAAFVARNKDRFDGYIAPDVALVIPTAEHLSPRSLAASATRAAVRACREELGIAVRAVADHRAARDLGEPRAILLPACRSISDAGWQAIKSAVEKGTTLVCSGWFESDDAGLPAVRMALESRPLKLVEAMAGLDGKTDVFRFGGTIPESWYAAAGSGVRRVTVGAGSIVHHPLPIEWADASPALARFYRTALAGAGIRPALHDTPAAGVIVQVVPFRDAWLIVAVNESSGAQQVVARRDATARRLTFDVPPGRAQMALIDAGAWRVIDKLL